MNRNILQKHFSQYPEMQPRDAIKLCCQSARGCEHLLGDGVHCEKQIALDRANALPANGIPPFETIGGKYARLHLNSPANANLPEADVVRMMAVTAEQTFPGEKVLENGLKLVSRMAAEGKSPFSEAAFDSEVASWRACGKPSVHHSSLYRNRYQPAYRLVLSDFGVLLPLLEAMRSKLAREGRVTVVLDGPCGSGKSTLAELLGKMYGCVPLAMDDFFLPAGLRTPERYAQPGGNVDYERFLQEMVPPLQKGESFRYNGYCCADGTMHPREHKAGAVTLLEGSYSHHPAFEKAWQQLGAIQVFLTVKESQQQTRLMKRNPQRFPMFQSRWIPLEKKYFQAYDREGEADMVLHSLSWENDE